MSGPDSIRRADPATLALEPAPIAPGWIVSGEPFARCAPLGDAGAVRTAVWDCTAGVFDWHYGAEETICIVAGEAIVTGEDGVTRRLRTGDVAIFPGHAWVRWHVPDYVRKIAIQSRPVPALLRHVAARIRCRLRRVTGLDRATEPPRMMHGS